MKRFDDHPQARIVALNLIIAISCIISLSHSGIAGTEVIDPTFNVNVETSTYLPKWVRDIVPLDNGKIIVNGLFNSYNGTPVGSLIRLNADGTLDETFNNNTFEPGGYAHRIVKLSDGGFVLYGNFHFPDGTELNLTIIKINEDGSLRESFLFSVAGSIEEISVDSQDRPIVAGFFQIDVKGNTENRRIIRLLPNGDLDETFDSPVQTPVSRLATHGDDTFYISRITNNEVITRLTDDGSVDGGFTATELGNTVVVMMKVQADGKVLTLSSSGAFQRMAVNGGLDPTFAQPSIPHQPREFSIDPVTGSLTVSYGTNIPHGYTFTRFLSDGAPDPSYTDWTYPFGFLAGHGVAPDGSVYAGEDTTLGGGFAIAFVKSFPNGGQEKSFNAGELGFQYIKPGRIRTLRADENNKVYIGGDFDHVNGTEILNLARLNSDGTLDQTFELQMGPGEGLFTFVNDIYGITLLPGGKLLVNGAFQYKVGIERVNVVVLNNDGSIDPSFAIDYHFSDYFGVSRRSQNHTAIAQNGGYVVGNSVLTIPSTEKAPLKITSSGLIDSSFNADPFPANSGPTVYAISSLPEGKFIIAGKYETGGINNPGTKSYIKKLNSDGSVDTEFNSPETTNEHTYSLDLLD
ncbi:MAG: delta-60 repeat domain-containing protein, partial [Rhodothermales bacterium]|nr:delta-60 repeat domain-containing protein [Rhodothermales bacterium]